MNIKVYFLTLFIFLFSVISKAEGLPKEVIFASSTDQLLSKMALAVGSRVFGKYNIKFRLKSYPTSRALVQANLGIVDGDAYRVFDLHKISKGEYPNLIRINETYLSVSFTAFVTDNLKNKSFTGWKDMKDYKAAVIRGNKKMEARARKHLPEKNRVEVIDYDQAFKMLLRNRLDIVVGKPSVGVSYMKENNNLHMIGKFGERKLFFYIHKKHKSLVSKIELEIKKLRESGELKEIENKVREEVFK
jgi:hypothetical protein